MEATRGFLWTGGQALVVRALSLLTFLVLARLLTPHDYGLAALSAVFIALLQTIALWGLSRALVQRPEVDELDLDTVFWTSVGIGVVLTAGMAVAAWPLARALHEPELRPILQVLSVGAFFSAVGSTHQAVLQRSLAFRALAAIQIAANAVATAVSIAFAALGFGVWALVIQALVIAITASIGQIACSGYRPGLSVSVERLRPIFAYARRLLGVSMMTFFNQRTDDFLIGSVLGSGALGIYTVGYRLLMVMMDVLSWSIGTVAFPIFSQLQSDTERLRRAHLSAARMASVVTLPLFFFVFATAPEMTRVLFGSRWDASVPVMRILCVFGAQHAVMQFNSALLQGIGRARTVLHYSLVGTALQVLGFIVAVRFGIRWVAASYVITSYVIAPWPLIAATRATGNTPLAYLRGTLPGFVSSGVMVAGVFATKTAVSGAMPEAAALVVFSGVALVVYLTTLRLVGRRQLDEALGYWRSGIARRPRLVYVSGARSARA